MAETDEETQQLTPEEVAAFKKRTKATAQGSGG